MLSNIAIHDVMHIFIYFYFFIAMWCQNVPNDVVNDMGHWYVKHKKYVWSYLNLKKSFNWLILVSLHLQFRGNHLLEGHAIANAEYPNSTYCTLKHLMTGGAPILHREEQSTMTWHNANFASWRYLKYFDHRCTMFENQWQFPILLLKLLE